MSAVSIGLTTQLVLAGAAIAAALATTGRARAVLSGTACAALAVAGLVTGALALAGRAGSVEIPLALPGLEPMVYSPDRLGGLFVVLVSFVGLLASVFGIGYVEGPSASRTSWAALAALLASLQFVPAAADAVSFLLAWEVMALTSTVLVLTDHARRPSVRSTAVWYSVMAHVSLALLIAGFAVLSASAGDTSFAGMAGVSTRSGAGALAFVLLFAGFAVKAGLVPVHVWLPRAHPEAPSHVSAVMSAAMVKLGLYGMALTCLRLLPGGPAWWGILLIATGAVSAVYGILQATVATDLKRLLAFSTTENVGLMVLALGAAVLLGAYGATAASATALVACLLLALSHAAFKATLFLGAGAVLHATGERDLDRMGGLGARMPWTAAAFGIACLGAAALPVTSGFAAEWTLLQSLIHGAYPDDRVSVVAMPVAVGVVALTAGLALIAFVRAYGIGFLARPRSDGAAGAHDGALTTRVAMVAGALAVLVVGLLPGPVAVAIADASGAAGIGSNDYGGLDLRGIHAVLTPGALAVVGLVLALPVVVVVVVAARRHPRRTSGLEWRGGGARVSPRMQYTATSYAEPALRVFEDALRPTRDVEVTHAEESRYLLQRVRFDQQVNDVVEQRLYAPAVARADRYGVAFRRLAGGSIHLYLGYSFAALVALLVVLAL